MTTHSFRRAIGGAGAIGLLSVVAACGSSSSTQPSGNNTPTGEATITLKLEGLSGREQLMETDFSAGSTAITRATAATVRSQMTRCESGTQPVEVCTATVPVGSVVSFFAVEATDGVVEPLPGEKTVPGTPAGDVEFVSFSGCTPVAIIDAGGDCSLVASAATSYTVTANFSNMNALAFDAEGAGTFTVTNVQARVQLSIPSQPNGIPSNTGAGDAFIIGTNPAPQEVAFLPTGSTVTVSAAPTGQAKFLDWSGPCSGGGGASCTLTEPVPNSSATTATAFLQYWDCGASGFADGPALFGCTLVNPSLVRINPSRAARR